MATRVLVSTTKVFSNTSLPHLVHDIANSLTVLLKQHPDISIHAITISTYPDGDGEYVGVSVIDDVENVDE